MTIHQVLILLGIVESLEVVQFRAKDAIGVMMPRAGFGRARGAVFAHQDRQSHVAAQQRPHGTGDLFVQLFDLYAAATARAQQAGLGVNAGHDLNLANLGRFATIQGILEVSIGHALVADALNIGLAAAVKAYLHALPGGLIK